MEYCDGGSLRDLLHSDVKLSENEIREIASCCVLGLHEIHRNKIIHSVFICDGNESIGHETGQYISNLGGNCKSR